MNCLCRLKIYTCQWAVWPYGSSHRIGTSYSGNLPFPTYTHPPHKALLQENACLENCPICRGAATELPWNATWPCEVFQGCNQPPWKSFAAFWRCAHAIGTLIEPCSTKSTTNFALPLAVPGKKYSMRPLLYNPGPGLLIWHPQSQDSSLRPQLPLQQITHVPTGWFLSRWLVKVVRTCPSSTPTLCSLNIQLS